MLFPEEDAFLLKAWIIKRLENTSDADADVLADYVLALLRHEGSVEEVRAMCEAEIPDFLKEDTSVFVNDVFDAIQYKSYLPSGGLPRPNPASAAASTLPPGSAYDQQLQTTVDPAVGALNSSRKRSYHERGDVQMQDAGEGYPTQPRSYKQARRGRGGRMDDATGRFQRSGLSTASPFQVPQPYGSPMPGAPGPQQPFDSNNPMEAMMRLQAMGVPLPPFPPFPTQQQPTGGASSRRRQRCRDYDSKGFCARGASCKFEHGTDSIFVPPAMPVTQSPGHEEYDPSNANMLMAQMPLPNPTHSNEFRLDPSFQSLLQQRQQQSQQHNGRNGHGKPHFPRNKGPRRAAFSAEGPVLDRSKSTIVVESIPEEHFSEEAVRSFFSQYGTIVDVSMRPYKHLAIVKYDSWNAANAAYRSPKVIFDNRFVKVFWYKEPGEDGKKAGPGSGGGAEQNGAAGAAAGEGRGDTSGPGASSAAAATSEIDMEDFLRRQEEAQRAFEEKKAKTAEIDRQREELEQKRKELLAKQQGERQKLYARIAAMSSSSGKKDETSSGDQQHDNGDGEQKPKPKSEMAEALRAQLAALEAEAKQLGLNPEEEEQEEQPWGGFTYRGGYRGRGRGAYAPRGRGGHVPHRGRGGYVPRGGGHAAYAAYSIDNRPKTVAVTGVDFTDQEKSETLRQFLFGIGEFSDIRETPASTQITFRDRKTAEKFFYGLPNKQIPGVEGVVELSWVTTPVGNQQGTSSTRESSPAAHGGPKHAGVSSTDGGDKDVAMPDDQQHQHQQHQQPEEQAEMDYDVGDDQWDIG